MLDSLILGDGSKKLLDVGEWQAISSQSGLVADMNALQPFLTPVKSIFDSSWMCTGDPVRSHLCRYEGKCSLKAARDCS